MHRHLKSKKAVRPINWSLSQRKSVQRIHPYWRAALPAWQSPIDLWKILWSLCQPAPTMDPIRLFRNEFGRRTKSQTSVGNRPVDESWRTPRPRWLYLTLQKAKKVTTIMRLIFEYSKFWIKTNNIGSNKHIHTSWTSVCSPFMATQYTNSSLLSLLSNGSSNLSSSHPKAIFENRITLSKISILITSLCPYSNPIGLQLNS